MKRILELTVEAIIKAFWLIIFFIALIPFSIVALIVWVYYEIRGKR